MVFQPNRRGLGIFVVIAAGCLASEAMGQTPLGAAFTYQGRLKHSGLLVNGLTDMKFSLYNAATGGSQQGAMLTFDGAGGNPAPVSVASGLFSVSLDFGSSVFNGEDRWLEIALRYPAGSGG